jgi:hypothetical protein
VSSTWDGFAVANDAPELIGARVIGESLWRYMTDSTTREVYRHLLRHVRVGRMLQFPLRCDAPRVIRRLAMTMTAVDELVRFDSQVCAVEARPEVPLWRRDAPRRSDVVERCSWCERIEWNGEWFDFAIAVSRLGLFEGDLPPHVTHVMCPDCLIIMDALMAERLPTRPPADG